LQFLNPRAEQDERQVVKQTFSPPAQPEGVLAASFRTGMFIAGGSSIK